MNHNQDIKILLQKFVLNQCSAQETEQVITYYRENTLTDDFPTVEEVKELLGTLPEMDAETANVVFSGIIAKGNEAKVIHLSRNKRTYKKYISIAAGLALLFTAGISYLRYERAANGTAKPVLTGKEITLQLENGNIQVISEDGTTTVTDADGNVIGNKNGNSIVYNTTSDVKKLVYNTITIPNGKRFKLQLSDGTQVHLNAGTSLKYPINFIAGQNRKVFLDGEAFFDVAKDAAHPFVVNANKLDVRVLGTHFNVSDYPEDEAADVVLVEGSVAMHTASESFSAEKSTILKPGCKGSFSKENGSIKVKPVNTSMYTAWINGGLVFRNMAFKSIIKRLERHYDITIENRNGALANERFNASFKNEPVEKVLSYFNDIHGISYTKKNNQIIIK
jgi:hypothetical protein